ncbi:uncharacterized protein N7446_005639 [Penicillium canescens]|uniref:Zn(2)-C6 fungal-type domain-containing protein n=1 Tax=Penicillium canescens TaxID=5083 RepID=A0AAD6IIT1_PENCN|nr:uncharacterized protein N7446_005639 [Penicillium canescens]KAJ6050118.1 hypothetical protein N7444_006834 [Penicillium canescens]KAJ6051008.1 hypothetical protein N7460_001542 [Penicillium canescens]KAJ6061519.1 hypothetical protein N7446_005639 [Penicillium canescens]
MAARAVAKGAPKYVTLEELPWLPLTSMTKCDEKKPTCGTCARLGIVCESVELDLKFRVVTALPPKKTGPKTGPAESDSSRLGLQPFSQHSRSSQIPNINLVHSLQHTDRDVFYSTYWEDHCLPALHPIFRSASELLGFPALKDTILALSSCNISRIDAERKYSTSFATMGTFSPNLIHQTRSQLYYSSAIKRFISLSQDDYRNNATQILTILVIFGYIEASMGNFDGYYCHVQGLSAFLVKLRETTGDSQYRALLTTWLQSQFLVWWARTYFSSLDVQRNLPSIAFPRDLERTSGSLHDLRAVALSILCESHRLNVKETLKHWKDQTDTDPVSLASDLPSDRYDTEDRLARLEHESKRLDEWLLYLPPSQQPLVVDASETSPIYFQAHDAAVNFAYYVVARIMQCTSFLHNLPSRDPQRLGSECLETEPWARLLLRIAKGTDMQTSIIRNNYTIGFSGLLLAASLRCQDLSLGMQIEKWLQTLEDKQPTEEGAFPVYQTLAVVKAINRQRKMGRDVFGVSQPMDDGGGTPKFTHYNSQMITTILVHGKWRATGNLFTECIDLYVGYGNGI